MQAFPGLITCFTFIAPNQVAHRPFGSYSHSKTLKPLPMSTTPLRINPLKLVTDTNLKIASNNSILESHWQHVIAQLQQQPCPVKSRRLKVVPHFRPLNGMHFRRQYKCIPKINLLGVWLQNAGFQIEGHVQVYTMDKLLVICMEE